ncbi:MAG: hypothetical protein IJ389_06835 [Clostridia bacterium]|nr:hypothetical protein [Clostridia bacterium]
MIYIAFEKCEDNITSQKKAAKKAKKLLFSHFDINCETVLSENGKPQLDDNRYHISSSHSGNVAVFALRCKEEKYDLPENVFTVFENGEGDIGIDVELIPDNRQLDRLNRISVRFMKRKFANVTELIKKWTLCEAYTKLCDIPLADSFKAHITATPAYCGTVSFDDKEYYLTVLV